MSNRKSRIEKIDYFLSNTGLKITSVVIFGSLIVFFVMSGLIHSI